MRKRIFQDKELFLSIINEKSFVNNFGQIKGTKLKNLPFEYRRMNTEGITEYLKMKQFYVFKTYSPETALSGGLTDIILENIKITGEFNKFLYDSI